MLFITNKIPNRRFSFPDALGYWAKQMCETTPVQRQAANGEKKMEAHAGTTKVVVNIKDNTGNLIQNFEGTKSGIEKAYKEHLNA